jgi:hypothetical protein
MTPADAGEGEKMSHCPSQDWDRYIAGEDSAAEAETLWWREHGNKVLDMAKALLCCPHSAILPIGHGSSECCREELMKAAADMVLYVTSRGEQI